MSAFSLPPEGLLPISTELVFASAAYIVLLLKPTPKNNFGISLTYSVLKLIAICSLFVTSLSITGFMRVPLLLGLLLNEVVLLVASIRNKQQFESICIRSMYPNHILAVRTVGELLTIALLLGVAIGTQYITCKCRIQLDETLLQIFDIKHKICMPYPAYKFIAEMFKPQLRGLAFAIAVTASVASISGWQYMLMGFTNKINHKQRDNLNAILRDAPWKMTVRSVYGFLQFLVVLLFVATFFVSGFSECYEVHTISGVKRMRYTLCVTSHAFLNAILAISQMFMADVHVRLAAIKDVENAGWDDDDDTSNDFEEDAHLMLASQGQDRAQSAIFHSKSMR